MSDRILAVPTALVSLAMLLMTAHVALADAIDGDWCHADGKRMKIRGPEIVTPGGNQTRGDYTRHSFSYVVPAGEAGAGESVSIILLSEYLAHARQGSESAPVQVWNRCPPGVAENNARACGRQQRARMRPAEQRAMQKHEGRGLRRALVVVAVSLWTDRD